MASMSVNEAEEVSLFLSVSAVSAVAVDAAHVACWCWRKSSATGVQQLWLRQ